MRWVLRFVPGLVMLAVASAGYLYGVYESATGRVSPVAALFTPAAPPSPMATHLEETAMTLVPKVDRIELMVGEMRKEMRKMSAAKAVPPAESTTTVVVVPAPPPAQKPRPKKTDDGVGLRSLFGIK
jgi:hypothetical protein